MVGKVFRLATTLGAAWLVCLAGMAYGQPVAYEEAPHSYWSAPLQDAGTALNRRLEDGMIALPQEDDLAAMRQVLRELGIHESSQTLVFSRTSVQKDLIRPSNPRAIFFHDEAYAAWMPGGSMELAVMDPSLGPIFYILDFHRPDRKFPRLDRPQSCLDCHGANMTGNVPGLMVRSVFPDRQGSVLFQAGTSLIDHSSPVNIRWGGWFVTGLRGADHHRGNAFAAVTGETIELDSPNENLRELSRFFPVSRYPRPTSDVVALMVLEHQIMMSSRLIEASYALRSALTQQQKLREELGEAPTSELTGTAKIIAESQAAKVLDVLLFRNEAELPENGLQGDPEFQEDFQRHRPRSASGQSLTQFHLRNRLFQYRCSYLIYSRLWKALPTPFLDLLYDRLDQILIPGKAAEGYSYLSSGERSSIRSILRETIPELQSRWKP